MVNINPKPVNKEINKCVSLVAKIVNASAIFHIQYKLFLILQYNIRIHHIKDLLKIDIIKNIV